MRFATIFSLLAAANAMSLPFVERTSLVDVSARAFGIGNLIQGFLGGEVGQEVTVLIFDALKESGLINDVIKMSLTDDETRAAVADITIDLIEADVIPYHEVFTALKTSGLATDVIKFAITDDETRQGLIKLVIELVPQLLESGVLDPLIILQQVSAADLSQLEKNITLVGRDVTSSNFSFIKGDVQAAIKRDVHSSNFGFITNDVTSSNFSFITNDVQSSNFSFIKGDVENARFVRSTPYNCSNDTDSNAISYAVRTVQLQARSSNCSNYTVESKPALTSHVLAAARYSAVKVGSNCTDNSTYSIQPVAKRLPTLEMRSKSNCTEPVVKRAIKSNCTDTQAKTYFAARMPLWIAF